MEEHRTSPRRRVLKTGKVVVSAKAPAVECTVRNVSESGALLQFSTTYGIPPNFDLIFDGARHACRVVWRTDVKIGVAFIV